MSTNNTKTEMMPAITQETPPDCKSNCASLRSQPHIFNLTLTRERIREARVMSGFTKAEASTLLGYANTTMIAKIESVQPTNRKELSIELLIKVSKTYGVSIDYLLGASDYPERDPETVEQMAVFAAVQSNLKVFSKNIMHFVIDKTHEQLHSSKTEHVIADGLELCDLFDRVRELNRTMFDENIRGGANLMKQVTKTRKLLTSTKNALERTRWASKRKKKGFIATVDGE